MPKVHKIEDRDSAWRLRADILSTKGLLWIAAAGRSGDPRPEVHLYLYDRYWRLAFVMQKRGRLSKASAFHARAIDHYRLSGQDGPPFAAALALSRPRIFTFTWAVSGRKEGDQDNAA